MARNGDAGTLLLAIDVGNTNIGVGVFDGDDLVADWRLSTQHDAMPDEYAVLLSSLMAHRGLSFGGLDAAIIASVVPKLTSNLREMIEKYAHLTPLVVGLDIELGVGVGIPNPQEVGADRLVNSLAAYRIYGGPAIVIDLGTATTFDVISADGVFIGGAIAPGILTSVEAMSRYTARLPRVEMARPPHAIGNDTPTAMQSGIILGHAAMVEGMIRRISAELPQTPRIIATGGLCLVMAEEVPAIQVADKTLTLKGLKMMYELNAPSGRAG
ncbi:MAG TPA: type III pantothenate kinase [Chloroflexota bacterium]|nr:type III pantothenate kinase [Chloroflexota bacterium]